jgi:hypothetical protein
MEVVEGISAGADGSFSSVQRHLARCLPTAWAASGGGAPLDLLSSTSDPPRLIDAELIEAGPMRAKRVFAEPEIRFAAFLDGTQTSKVITYVQGIALIHGTVAAAIRIRRNRRMATWGRPIIRQSLYAPRRQLDDATNAALDQMRIPVVDTSGEAASALEHPFALRDAAIHRVQKDREAAEQALAERWCTTERDPLFIDGGISGSERVAVSACTVGVVKSHRTIYAEARGLQTVLALDAGERSSVFRVTSPKRVPVASWYLRLRDPRGRDPMWGLVRVEIANPTRIDEHAIGDRANEISSWILGEVTPLSLPDARWDKMVYGVRDCEEFLKAIT